MHNTRMPFAQALCPYCGKPIAWIATQSGKPVMVEREFITIATERGRLIEGKPLHVCQEGKNAGNP